MKDNDDKHKIAILNGSFDAGFLLDEKGVIIHSNVEANTLFGIHPQPGKVVPNNAAAPITSLLTFWTHLFDHNVTVDADVFDWRQIMELLISPTAAAAKIVDDVVAEWPITGTHAETKQQFSGVAKLTLLRSANNEEESNMVMMFVRRRHADEGTSLFLAGAGTGASLLDEDSSSRLTANSGSQRRRLLRRPAADTTTTTTDTFSSSASSDAQQRESIMTAVVEASLDPLFQINEAGIIQMLNSAAVQAFGFERDELLGKNISMICGGDHHHAHDEYLQRYLATGDARVIGKRRELVARRKNGTEFPIELAVMEVDTFTGDERLFCGYVRDLTALQEQEKSIVRRERLVTGIIDASLDPLFQINQVGVIQTVNRAACTMFGYDKQELLDQNISIIVGAEHAPHHDQYLRRYMETGDARVIGKRRELPARRKDGSEFIIELSLAEVETETDEVRLFCGYVRDLTQLKEDEKKILRRERLMTGIIDASLDPLFQINQVGAIQTVNRAACTMFGYTQEELLDQNISIIVGAEHAPHHDMYLRRYMATGVSQVIGKRRELQARRKDGSEFTIELSLAEVETESHEVRLFCGHVRDLTQQKESEDKLRRRESFTNKIIEASCDALFVTRGDGRIIRVNAMAVKIFDMSREALREKNIYSLFSAVHSSWIREEMQKWVAGGVVFAGAREMEALNAESMGFPVSLTVAELQGTDGSTQYSFFLNDLTERKRLMTMQIEKTAAEVLLMNVLPPQIATQLMNDPQHIAESHQLTAVVFADIVGFTAMSSKMTAREVVSMLNELFTMFDEVVEKYSLNKIKTIGDCYMVTNVPPQSDDLVDECNMVCHFALDMMDCLHEYNSRDERRNLDLRVGLHIGDVVAGVVGTKRFLYDLWGDCVNTASRMESSGVPGKIQVTEDVVNLLGDSFAFEKRGLVKVKGKGEMMTYFLTERTSAPVRRCLSTDDSDSKGSLDEDSIFMDNDSTKMGLYESLRNLEMVLAASDNHRTSPLP